MPGGLPDGEGAGADGVARRPSKRQQEKAPEGRPPHVPDDDEGGESRFKEELSS